MSGVRRIEHHIGRRATGGASTRRSPVVGPGAGGARAAVCLAGPTDPDAAASAYAEWPEASLGARVRGLSAVRARVAGHLDELARAVPSGHGTLLSAVRVDGVDDADAIVNATPRVDGTARFTASGEVPRRLHRGARPAMTAFNVAIPVPAADDAFGGWRGSPFGERPIPGHERVGFCTRAKVVRSCGPTTHAPAAGSCCFGPAQ